MVWGGGGVHQKNTRYERTSDCMSYIYANLSIFLVVCGGSNQQTGTASMLSGKCFVLPGLWWDIWDT